LLLAGALSLALLSGAARAQDGERQSYTVVAGDTLFVIAQRYGIPLEALIAANNIADANLLEVGQVLVIPTAAEAAQFAGVPAAEVTRVYARPGDTLAALAARYGLLPDDLASLNTISPTARLFPGQPLAIPSDAELPQPLRFGAITSVDLPERLIQGRTGRVVVRTRRPLSVEGLWNGLPVSFSPVAGDPAAQFAYLPAPALIEPSSYWLSLSYTAANGLVLSQAWPIAVGAGPYESQIIELPPDRGALLDPALVQSELEKVVAAWSPRTPQLLWSAVLSRPIDLQYATTSPFGTRRAYGGGPVDSYHAGQDFGAPPGVPVVAPGDGVVVLAEPLQVRGNAVIVDHGRGVFTGYWHLSEIKVAPGQPVTVGDVLGLVGNTGLSTGAHLHWELRIYGIAVDPMQFVEEPLAVFP
jgi:murein DD-endopeptidase MepM/ murein hydrolase activator NlpD